MHQGGHSRSLMIAGLIGAALGEPMMPSLKSRGGHKKPMRTAKTLLPDPVWQATKAKKRAQRLARRKNRK